MDIIALLDKHMTEIVWLVWALVLWRLGAGGLTRLQAWHTWLQDQKLLASALEYAYAEVQRQRRKNPSAKLDALSTGMDIARRFFTEMGKPPPAALEAYAKANWTAKHEAETSGRALPPQ